jgi:aminopeptidase N
MRAQQDVAEDKSSMRHGFYVDPTLEERMYPRHRHDVLAGTFPDKVIDSTQDVLSYELFMDWTMALTTSREQRPDRKAESRVRMNVRMVEGGSTLKLHAEALIIDSVTVDGVRATFVHERPDLIIDVSTSPGDTIDVVIHYAIGYDLRGFYAYSQAEVDTSEEMLEPIAFTFSQPNDARWWFPCHDVPFDKAVFTAHVRVPKGFTVVCNGERVDSIADTDSTSWQTWHQPIPQPTYLCVANASKYHRYDQTFRSVDGRDVLIQNYHWLADHEGAEYHAVNALQTIPSMFNAFEEVYGRYPFETYGHVTIAGVKFGGMEHQTMSTINRRWLKGDAESGYAHEVAHQWLGDEVTCATWADIWLNEGGASFSEAVWYEYKDGPSRYLAQMLIRRSRYLRNAFNEPPIYDIPLIIIFNEATTYNKSSWVYHMMRRMVGDSAFFSTLRSYIAKYSLGAAQTVDMQAHFAENIPNPAVDWNTFFDQWLLGKGHPRFVVIATTNDRAEGGRYASRVTVRQTQSGDGVPDTYVVPLTIRFMNTAQIYDTTIIIDQRVAQFTFSLPFVPDTVVVDPRYNVLAEGTGNVVTHVDERSAPLPRIHSPLPVLAGSDVVLSTQPGTTISVYTINGVLIWSGTATTDVEILDSSAWPSGIVFVSTLWQGAFHSLAIPVVK